MRPYLAKNIVNKLQSHDLAISFTDGFSLTLGYVHKENLKNPIEASWMLSSSL